MILRFGLENHYSVRDHQEISMVATSLKDDERSLFNVIGDKDRTPLRVVPVTAIYGANASGKSSILSGLSSIAHAVRESHSGSTDSEGTPYHPFALQPSLSGAPSKFDIDFVIDETRFHYGYSLDGKIILSEWLYSYPLNAQRQTRSVLFHRDTLEPDNFLFGKGLRGENKAISKLVRPNSLFLSAAAQNSHPMLSQIYDYFSHKITKRTAKEQPDLATNLSNFIGDSQDKRSEVLRFLKAADVGICDIQIEKKPLDNDQIKFREDLSKLLGSYLPNIEFSEAGREHTEVRFLHTGSSGKNYPIHLHDESAGTRTLLSLLGTILDKLTQGGVLIVDELDSTLHPLLSRRLLELFSSPISNPGQAQLIFSTHDTNLLSGGLLRRDQIVLTEKDQDGATHAYSLSDIKVRSSENLESGYLSGRYGAIPFLGFDRFLIDEHATGTN